ncbi:hypothetical protein ACODT5_17235 [Streptomyces sp. 5.8]|uniref:hypothetical protein n=1 Tax=Streptomyces sp. 5.8 TaxID=3406571 RepID=UPI003BB806A3
MSSSTFGYIPPEDGREAVFINAREVSEVEEPADEPEDGWPRTGAFPLNPPEGVDYAV